MAKYRYLGPEALLSAQNQIDSGKEKPRAPAQTCAPVQKIIFFLLKQCRVCLGRKFMKKDKRVGTK